MMDNLMKDIRKVLITREQLQKRVAEMGQEIIRARMSCWLVFLRGLCHFSVT